MGFVVVYWYVDIIGGLVLSVYGPFALESDAQAFIERNTRIWPGKFKINRVQKP